MTLDERYRILMDAASKIAASLVTVGTEPKPIETAVTLALELEQEIVTALGMSGLEVDDSLKDAYG